MIPTWAVYASSASLTLGLMWLTPVGRWVAWFLGLDTDTPRWLWWICCGPFDDEAR